MLELKRARSSARLERQAHNLRLEEKPVGQGFKSLRAHHKTDRTPSKINGSSFV